MLLNPRLVPGPANKASFLRGLTANERHERHNQHCTVHSPSFARAAGFDAGPLAPQRWDSIHVVFQFVGMKPVAVCFPCKLY